MAIHRSGLKQQLEEAGVEMVSGPGCPGLHHPRRSPRGRIDLVGRKGENDPGHVRRHDPRPHPERLPADRRPRPGIRVRIVYSPEEALEAARPDPDKDVVFFGAGFETTIPGIAFTIAEGVRGKACENFSVLAASGSSRRPSSHPRVGRLRRLRDSFIPGTSASSSAKNPMPSFPRNTACPGAIAGFEPEDILAGILSVLDQIRTGKPRVRQCLPAGRPAGGKSRRPGPDEGDARTRDALWRGLGTIPLSGLKLRKKYSGLRRGSEIRPDHRPLRPRSARLPLRRGLERGHRPRRSAACSERPAPRKRRWGRAWSRTKGRVWFTTSIRGSRHEKDQPGARKRRQADEGLHRRAHRSGVPKSLSSAGWATPAISPEGSPSPRTAMSSTRSFSRAETSERLAVNGTVNDLVVSGAVPRFLSLALISKRAWPGTP